MSVKEFKAFVKTDETEPALYAKLAALELLIRKYTNNNFQNRNIRYTADIASGMVFCDIKYLAEGDTVQVSESRFNNGLLTIDSFIDGLYSFAAKEKTYTEKNVLVTKIEYPIDVKMGIVNMMKWELENRDKVGIQSETVSRHAVTYFNMDGENSMLGYPKSLCGFLKPYMKARF